ncbi:AGC protein kinase [Puccinia sorghi]|uniref:AGC protein kinase n=1 Tax=Puccinia sorghi TaxID=27349 RepID=A0A0L6VA87_9BASI|nr:AGC protein kinase [Puccinia sorghi]
MTCLSAAQEIVISNHQHHPSSSSVTTINVARETAEDWQITIQPRDVKQKSIKIREPSFTLFVSTPVALLTLARTLDEIYCFDQSVNKPQKESSCSGNASKKLKKPHPANPLPLPKIDRLLLIIPSHTCFSIPHPNTIFLICVQPTPPYSKTYLLHPSSLAPWWVSQDPILPCVSVVPLALPL